MLTKRYPVLPIHVLCNDKVNVFAVEKLSYVVTGKQEVDVKHARSSL